MDDYIPGLSYQKCACHTVQCVIGDGFKLNDTYNELVKKCIKIVSQFRNVQVIAEELRNFQKKVN